MVGSNVSIDKTKRDEALRYIAAGCNNEAQFPDLITKFIGGIAKGNKYIPSKN